MNNAQLAELGRNAKAFAACYSALVEALVREGLPEELARREARACATMVAVNPPAKPSETRCPLCGN